MAIRRISCRFLQMGSSSYINWTNLKGLESSGTTAPLIKGYSFMPSNSMKLNCRYIDNRQISQIASTKDGKQFEVTLALVRELEAQGVSAKQAEAFAGTLIRILNENVSRSFASKAEIQTIEMGHESNLSKFELNLSKFKTEVECNFSEFKTEVECNLSKFKSEVKSSQEHHFGMLQRENEKLRVDIEKMSSELRNQIDKVTAGQRLDLNLEKGNIRDQLANQNAETSNLTNKLDREIYALKAHLEGAKYDVIKYCVGTLVSAAAVGLAVLRTLK